MSNDYFINGRAMDEAWTNHGRRSKLFQPRPIQILDGFTYREIQNGNSKFSVPGYLPGGGGELYEKKAVFRRLL